ncbi:MAG: hypothetical protein ACLQVW_02215, partial [Limisphaerales bacterium]
SLARSWFFSYFAGMKTRFVILLMLTNIAVLAAGFVYFGQYSGQQAARERASAEAEVAAWRARATAATTLPPMPPSTVYVSNNFNWSQLESTDYRQYIANLRAIGCPQVTIQDIILTDVMRLYAQRRGQYYQNGREFKFWETNEKRKLKQPQLEEREKQLAAINKELPAVLRELLGINYERELNKYFVDSDEDNRRLAFLTEDKRSQVLALRDQFEGERERVLYLEQDGQPSPGALEKLRDIQREQDAAFLRVLTPREKEEYDLTMSPTADRLREQLVGFNPSEQEFRDLFRRQQAIDLAYQFENTNDDAVRAAQAAAEQTMLAEFKGDLAPDRITQLDRSQDPEFQKLCVLAERFDLPTEAAQTLVDMRQAAEEEKRQVLSNKDIPPERVEVVLKAIQAETEKTARATLGEDAFTQYAPSAAWIQKLGTN